RMETGAEDDEGEHQASSAVGGHEYERVFQLQGTYIVSSIKSGILVVHQQRAHERVLYERFIASIKTRQVPSQQQLFPVNMHLPPADALILRDILPELRMLGLDIREMSGDSFVVDGIPSGRKEGNIVPLVEAFLESYKEGLEQHTDRQANAARSLARSMAVGIGQILKKEEMHSLIDDLFACATPGTAPDGRPCLVVLGLDELAERFRK
ncbi:MAG TPA: hypothetical protein P5248_04875, partial [Bacteroidales bacterium]|nr:hypothetical protein [Bacteroidales bacterium]